MFDIIETKVEACQIHDVIQPFHVWDVVVIKVKFF